MKENNWHKTLDKTIPFFEWNSIKKQLRTQWKPVRHSNTAHELHLILEGTCQVELGEHVYELTAGEGLLILPHTFHCCRSHSEPFMRLTVSFIPQNQNLFTTGDVRPDYIRFQTTPAMNSICSQILDEVDKGSSYLGNEMLGALFSQLMIHFLRTIQPDQEHEAIIHQNNIPNLIDQYFCSMNMQGGHTRKGLSQLLHCSERQLNRILADLYGMTFQEKRLLARMDYAKFLLRNTDMNIPEISALVGYSNETSFYKVFKSACHTTPKEFRHKYRTADKKTN